MPGRPVISNCGYYTFLDFHLQPLAQAVKSFIKNTNNFFNKLRSFSKLPGDVILCTADIVGMYPSIPHKERLSPLRNQLDNQMGKYISSNTLCNLAEVVLKDNIFKFGKKTLKPKRWTAIGMKFPPPYRILFMAELEEEII